VKKKEVDFVHQDQVLAAFFSLHVQPQCWDVVELVYMWLNQSTSFLSVLLRDDQVHPHLPLYDRDDVDEDVPIIENILRHDDHNSAVL
jgi:hypothetical protein